MGYVFRGIIKTLLLDVYDGNLKHFIYCQISISQLSFHNMRFGSLWHQ